ncbi:MAG: phosphatidylglycerol-prolipoprotein diacylglyceryl transferase [Pseudomonadota bacterium]|jgi:phosphatidylglycerol:prolipoprotein diacylglycerol transferase
MTSPLVHPEFDPIALALGPLAIRWYGLMYLLAFLAFMWLGRRRIAHDPQRSGITLKDLDDFLIWGVLGVVLGGRLGYAIFYKPEHYLSHPLELLAIWQGGMAFHGGLLGVILAMLLFSWHRRHLAQADASAVNRFWALADFVAPLVPLGLAFGRLGNFINGELWGRPTDPASIPWAMVFPQSGTADPRHPSQLYQMALEGLALFLVLQWLARRPQPRALISGVFLTGYGLARFLVEFAREPDGFLGLLQLGLSMGQWLSLPMILLGLALVLWSGRRSRESTD